ncbi:DNA-directed RNA polymerase III subunit RPC3-like [Melia azedarach]|uniref:DNA-directed RNA polymerase III subunit RPC3-like n=1 Tax=Melia azedarach TaxID=155640 RepID=A0ACC1X3H2_MELAZ|nr:DNA-directed RNA polymerase III subunit RPC3-like [Melia azedarach]
MVAEYGVKYAVHIITNHFGDLVAKVCDCLLRRGPLTRQNIKRYTELSDEQVKNALLVLIQQNCVQAFSTEQPGTFGDAPKVNTQYAVLFDNILHRLRFAKFLTIVSQEFDKQCGELLQGLLEHGRLTLKQMFDRAKASQQEGNLVVLDSVREILLKLVTAHYVERCPAPEPLLMPTNEEENPARKRGPKSAKKNEESETIEQQVIAAAVPMEAMRFSVVTEMEFDDGGEGKEKSKNRMIPGEKRKHHFLESDDCGAGDEQTVLYRANFEEFIRHLRHKACIDNVRERLDDGAASVLSAMLEATRSAEKKVKTKNSVPLSLSSIYEEVIKSEAGRNMTLDHVRASLVQLGQPPFVKGSSDSYSIEFEKIIEIAQNDEVESIVLKRYGRDAYRIFRLLSKAGRLLETDKISDTTFVEKKDAPKVLYKLWKDGYLHMEKLVVAGARQSQFLLWKVNKHILWEHVLDEMFHAALNLSLRVACELDQEKELLNLPADKRTGALQDRYNRLRKVRILMESSQMKLDDSIMLFHDF